MSAREIQDTLENEDKPRYEKPEMKVMTEEELLVAFQVTQAGTTWWVM